MKKISFTHTSVPEAGEGKRGEKGHIGYLLRQAYASHRTRMEQALRETGLTLPQFSILTMLAAYPNASGAELARLSLLTPQTMSVIVANLERAGFVVRTPHKVHGRIQQIRITADGAEILSRCKLLVQSVEQCLQTELSDQDEALVRRWLVNVAK
ncbi:MarR family winged helix-turn-helix transcriptional regulator [Undibacterium rugosum]|uniref:Winged helix-turn-helix transcriptional regulator n=1 Tax=Undibacterium rugosum TaxID=2762291 RepID=A0A923I8B7_9BURK|nr:MarR family winged helix-turn-helix transcriptional regulator [Undibacterium rugosum]MBC3935428.1 winged helix-turn-helix transcriptional regulator [Undibacterium rugosum]MBR7778797.1 winged helix-turn-helix transcriptional regulator [Undibacterium rugosum]